MTNPDNVGGLPELPEPVMTAYTKADGVTPFWKYDGMVMAHEGRHVGVGGNKSIHLFDADQMRAYGELCRAAPAGGDVPDARDEQEYDDELCFPEHEVEAMKLEAAQDSAPAGSGEVFGLVDTACNEIAQLALVNAWPYPEAANELSRIAGNLNRAAALLRKLQQGAE